MMKNLLKIFTTTAAVLLLSPVFAQAEENAEGTVLRFKHKLNDSSKILCTVDEDVFMNNRFINHSVIVNRITCLITDEKENGCGTLEANFMTSEQNTVSSGKSYSWGEEYYSKFDRTAQGVYDISDEYFMPTVRDVPVFPDYAVNPGDSWTGKGHEAHDLRHSFNIEKPYKVPFTADYEYLRDEITDDGRILNVIESKYNLYFKNPYKPTGYQANAYIPETTMGHSDQIIFWDNEKGMIDHYSEEFQIMIETYSGDLIKFQGTSHAEVTEFQRESTEENLNRLTDTVNELGLKNVEVKRSEKGLTISIENIQFLADSAVLLDSEKEKLSKIAAVLKTFSNDLLITGHCAKRGTVQSQQELSEQRAESVANFLEESNVRAKQNMFVQGKGAAEPVASNSTEAGRSRNRRVEITIMDK